LTGLQDNHDAGIREQTAGRDRRRIDFPAKWRFWFGVASASFGASASQPDHARTAFFVHGFWLLGRNLLTPFCFTVAGDERRAAENAKTPRNAKGLFCSSGTGTPWHRPIPFDPEALAHPQARILGGSWRIGASILAGHLRGWLP
jgi:hypothetical protein